MTRHSPRRTHRPRRLVFSATLACAAAIVTVVLWPRAVLSHETLTTTVLYDREIVRIMDKHCVMCHVEEGPAFPLSTYEQTWLLGRKMRADVIARHMPPWAAVPGYGEFANDNSLTLRETQFVVGWVEGLGPRNAGTVFTNTADSGTAHTMPMPGHAGHAGHWRLGEPDLTVPLPPTTIGARQPNDIRRIVIDLGLKGDQRIRGLEYMPGDRPGVRAAFFTVRETGQWIGSWTPWYGFVELPAGSAYRLAAGSHIIAEVHYRRMSSPGSASEAVVDNGMLGVFLANAPAPIVVSDVRLEAKRTASGRGVERLRAETRIAADTYALALRPELPAGVTSLEVSVRRPDGGTDILLFAKDIPVDWPTPYVFVKPILLRRNSIVSVTAYRNEGATGPVRVTMSRY
jgi:hypothetical protein